ncbi:MAG: rod-binding protein [Ancalomicrobiaceae bacterium]|nr:rod-binding protein [Ancalomicrobiaceae bacterium]
MAFGLLNPPTGRQALPEASHQAIGTTARLKALSQDYEATFLSNMFSHMFDGIPTDGLGHGGSAEETWRGMLVTEYAKSVTKAGGIGLAKDIYASLVRLQEHKTQ